MYINHNPNPIPNPITLTMSDVEGKEAICSNVKCANFPTFDKYDPTEHDKWAEGGVINA